MTRTFKALQLQHVGFVEQILFGVDPRGPRVKVPIRHRMQATLPRRSYGHRIRESRDPDPFPDQIFPQPCSQLRGLSMGLDRVFAERPFPD